MTGRGWMNLLMPSCPTSSWQEWFPRAAAAPPPVLQLPWRGTWRRFWNSSWGQNWTWVDNWTSFVTKWTRYILCGEYLVIPCVGNASVLPWHYEKIITCNPLFLTNVNDHTFIWKYSFLVLTMLIMVFFTRVYHLDDHLFIRKANQHWTQHLILQLITTK